MKKPKRILAAIMSAAVIASAVPSVPSNTEVLTVEAHSGRTDSSGGHRDNRNASGLGYYHYHCGGYPPHLHPGGVCPYSGGGGVESNSGSGSGSSGTQTPKLKISKTTLSLVAGKSATLKLNMSGASWSSSNKKVATVSSNGVVKAKKAGKTTISAKYNGQTVKCRLTVKEAPIIKVSVNDWKEDDGIITLRIKNVSNSRVVIQPDMRVFDWSYAGYSGPMYTDRHVKCIIPAGSVKYVRFYDENSYADEYGNLVSDNSLFVFRFMWKGQEKKCVIDSYFGNSFDIEVK